VQQIAATFAKKREWKAEGSRAPEGMLPLPPALYSSMIIAITATIMTMAPPTSQFLPLLRARAARDARCCVSCAARWAAHRVSFSCWVSCGSAIWSSPMLWGCDRGGSCRLRPSHGLRSDGRCGIPERQHHDSTRITLVWSNGGLQTIELTLLCWKPCCFFVHPQNSCSVALCLYEPAQIQGKSAAYAQ
jgi:hypothetical protein